MEKKPKNKKVVLLFFVLTKLLISLSLTVILPIIVFFLFISIKPREVVVINEYIKTQINKISYIKNFSFNTAKIFLDKNLNIGYKVNNLHININNNIIILPDIAIKINIFNIITKKKYINTIELNNFYHKFKHDNKNEIKIKNNYLATIKNIITYIYDNNIPINSIIVNNSRILL